MKIFDFPEVVIIWGKVKVFWEGHKNVRNRPYGFEIYVKTIRTIPQIFVAFSEKLNFTKLWIKRRLRILDLYHNAFLNPFSPEEHVIHTRKMLSDSK